MRSTVVNLLRKYAQAGQGSTSIASNTHSESAAKLADRCRSVVYWSGQAATICTSSPSMADRVSKAIQRLNEPCT